MAHQTPKKALFLALFSFFIFTTASARFFLDDNPAPVLSDGKDLTDVVVAQVEGNEDYLQGKASPSPVANSPTASVPSKPDNLGIILKDICGKTDFPMECVAEVRPFFHSGQVDPLHVVRSAMQGTMEELKKAIEEAKKEAAEIKAISPGAATVITEVKESYEDALDNFGIALEALDAKDIGTLNTMLSAAITDFSDNDDNLSSKAEKLIAFDTELKKMTSNCLAITSMLPVN